MCVVQLIVKHQLQRDPAAFKYLLTSLEQNHAPGTSHFLWCFTRQYRLFSLNSKNVSIAVCCSTESAGQRLSALVALLKHGKRLGLLRDVTVVASGKPLWCDVIPLSTIRAALAHSNDRVCVTRARWYIYCPANYAVVILLHFRVKG